MLSWNPWDGDPAAWDELLLQCGDYNVYQAHKWGEHKRRFGWSPVRLTVIDGNHTVAMSQVLVRRFPARVAVAWVPGGPVGLVEAWGNPFRQAVQRAVGARQLYCRVNPMREQILQDVERMQSAGWRRPTSPILSGRSLAYRPSDPEPVREARASRNWRHNLRRSSKYGHVVRVWPVPDADEVLAVYEAMQSHKRLHQQISRDALVSILDAFGDQCLVVRCDDASGRLLALRGTLLFGTKGWDIFAAATPDARNVYASHATFWELMTQCAALGVQWYDMSGVDPIQNKGVYDFKKGTGASELSYLGEWDWATSSALRRVADYLIKRRAGGM
jgi:lipid II:glycine glycyltransferase (peptidoglycan interpeptide bridge formation enzyme)